MLIALLLCHVAGEWVQISQQHYRKSYKPTNLAKFDRVTEIHEDTTKANRIYINQTQDNWINYDKNHTQGTVVRIHKTEGAEISEGDFNKYTRRVDLNDDSYKRIKLPEFGFISDNEDDDVYNFRFTHNKYHDEKNTLSSVESIRTPETTTEFGNFEHGYKYYPSVTISAYNDDKFDDSYTVYKKGSIKRVQLDSRTVRTPIITQEHNTEANIKKNVEEIYLNKTIKTDPDRKIVDNVKITNMEPSEINRPEKGDSKSSQHVRNDVRMEYKNQSDSLKQIGEISQDFTEKLLSVTKEDFGNDFLKSTGNVNPYEVNTKSPWKHIPKVAINAEKDFERDKKETKLKNENKLNAIENLVKFMKMVTDTISRNTRRSVYSKVRYLENLQDTILTNIKQRIDSTWPDDEDINGDGPKRKARAAPASARGHGHVEFPSSESALMTISFLTFAVYLIKLILQIIQTYKNKAMMVGPAVVATVGRTAAYVHRHVSNSN